MICTISLLPPFSLSPLLPRPFSTSFPLSHPPPYRPHPPLCRPHPFSISLPLSHLFPSFSPIPLSPTHSPLPNPFPSLPPIPLFLTHSALASHPHPVSLPPLLHFLTKIKYDRNIFSLCQCWPTISFAFFCLQCDTTTPCMYK